MILVIDNKNGWKRMGGSWMELPHSGDIVGSSWQLVFAFVHLYIRFESKCVLGVTPRYSPLCFCSQLASNLLGVSLIPAALTSNEEFSGRWTRQTDICQTGLLRSFAGKGSGLSAWSSSLCGQRRFFSRTTRRRIRLRLQHHQRIASAWGRRFWISTTPRG